MNNNSELIKALNQSYENYHKYGPRSTEKLKPIHEYFAKILKKIWGKEYDIHYLGNSSKEKKVNGKYYQKTIDISVFKNNKIIFCLGIKFITSNYKQNSINYFENMMGETANIQSGSTIPYAHVVILRNEIPYYKRENKKQNEKNPKKIEYLNENDILKYLNLHFDNYQAHRPFAICLLFISIKNGKVFIINANDLFNNKKISDLIENNLSLNVFLKKIENYKNFSNTIRLWGR
jgi:hypothetical protein